MYSESLYRDAILFTKAFMTNQLARFCPQLYVRIYQDTGRGETEENPDALAQYFHMCVQEYIVKLGMTEKSFKTFIDGKAVMEYGPGDCFGVAMIMLAYGAESVTCVDRFPLKKSSAEHREVYNHILELLKPTERQKARQAFNIPGNIDSDFRPEKIRYVVSPDGTAPSGPFHLVISRAVLEHVNNLEKTVRNMSHSLHPQGFAVHLVDLRSHGLDRYKELDFLTWPSSLYRAMYSQKGYPNRWRLDEYKKQINKHGLQCVTTEIAEEADQHDIKVIEPYLSKEFRHVSDDDLKCLQVWIICKKESLDSGSGGRQCGC